MKELQMIQTTLKANKGQYNSFGKYSYRSCEDILEALKPLLGEHKCNVTLSDELVLIGERYYIKATARIANATGEVIATTAYAREPEVKKGMDESQITGTASSYARKYALNGLFCIDDAKDADTDAYHHQTASAKPISKAKQKTVTDYMAKLGVHQADFDSYMGKTVAEYTEADYGKALTALKKKEEKYATR